VVLTVTGGGRGTDRSSHIVDLTVAVFNVLEDTADTGLKERPATSILLFLLSPDNLGILVLG